MQKTQIIDISVLIFKNLLVILTTPEPDSLHLIQQIFFPLFSVVFFSGAKSKFLSFSCMEQFSCLQPLSPTLAPEPP